MRQNDPCGTAAWRGVARSARREDRLPGLSVAPWSLLWVVAAAAALCGAGLVRHAHPAQPEHTTATVEIVYASKAALRHVVATGDAEIVRDVPALRVAELRPFGDAAELVAALRRDPRIVDARRTVRRARAGNPALTLGLVSTPAGGAYEWQWYATGMDRVPSAVLAAAARTTIAVVDTGVDLTAPALAGKVGTSYDVRSGGRVTADEDGHGTFVASLAAGSTAAGGAVAGFGGAARLMVVKVGDGAHVTDVDVAAGIVAAVQRGARIVNVSIAGPARSLAEASAVAYAARRGALLVAAVGNDALNGNPAEYPAALLQPVGSNGVGGAGLAVGASDLDGRRASFSEHGSFVSLAAPGTNVFGAISQRAQAARFPRVTVPGVDGGLYGFASGTSYAAPQVAGAAALVWAANPRLTTRRVVSILEQSASGRGAWTPELGFGVVDVAAAVEAAGGVAR